LVDKTSATHGMPAGDPRRPILHVITGLGAGGAETMLYKLLGRTAGGPFRPVVISLTGMGPVGEKIRALGIEVLTLGMSRRLPTPFSLWKLGAMIRRLRPALIQSWMYHADLVAGLASVGAGRVPIVWGIRHNELDSTARRRTVWTAKTCALLSHVIPAKIVCCSAAGRATHERLGYDRRKMMVIPNGFDLGVFGPNQVAYRGLREELGLRSDSLLVGLVARYHPEKDHRTFVEAAAHCTFSPERVHFVLCGQGASADNQELVDLIASHRLAGRFRLLGLQDRMPWVTAAFDVACSSSRTEGFPNVLGEAMAAGVPCVVTNVGESAYVIGETGIAVPPSDPKTFAAALDTLLSLPVHERRALGEAARKRVSEMFDLEVVARRFVEMQLEVVSQCAE